MDIISMREFQRSPKKVLAQLVKKGTSGVLMSKNTPQAKITPIKQKAKRKGNAHIFLGLVGLIPKGSGLPKDLAKNHDKYTWGA